MSDNDEPEPIYSPDYIDAIADDIASSYRLAMLAAGIPESTADAIATTVADYIGNHYDEAWQR